MSDVQTIAPVALEQPELPSPGSTAGAELSKAVAGAAELANRLFTRERVELIKKQVCPAGITDGEFALFLEQCRRSGLDPLMKEAYCVPRKTKVKDAAGNEREIEVFTFQAAEQGMQVRAHRSGVFLGMRAGAVYSKDKCSIDFAAGKVNHTADVTQARGEIVGAWAIAFRSDLEVSPVAFVRMAEYSGAGPLWKGKPETMIIKVARAQALRLSFPYEFAGAFTPEELDGPGSPNVVDAYVSAGAAAAPIAEKRTRAEEIRAAIVKPPPAPAAAAAPSIPMSAMRFGTTGKGKPLLECSAAELEEGLQLAITAIAESPTASWAPSVKERITLMHAEQERRAQALATALDEPTTSSSSTSSAEPARQPGEEG